MMNGGNSMFANISSVITTEHPFFSLTESATPTSFTPFGAQIFLVVSRNRRKVSSADKTTSISSSLNYLRT